MTDCVVEDTIYCADPGGTTPNIQSSPDKNAYPSPSSGAKLSEQLGYDSYIILESILRALRRNK